MTSNAVVVSDVSKSFRIYRDRNRSLKATVLKRSRAKYEEFWALKDIDLEIPQGQTFGLLGNNGSGKSTLLKCIAQILEPNKGSIRHVGRMAAMLEVGSGFHPELSGRDNVYLNGAILGMSKAEIDKKFESIVDFSGVEDFIDQPVKNYSSGMYVRLGFSVSIHVEPDILLVDEVLAVGDMAFQEKCTEKFSDLRREGRTVVVVSHAVEQMRTFCDQAAWLHHGQLMGIGVANDIITEYSDQAHDVRVHGDGPGQGAEFTADGRYGSGEARIDRVEILDAAGRDVEQVRNGDEVRVRLHYTCYEPIPTPVFGFAIEHESGFRLSAHNTMDSDLTVPPMAPGSGSVDLVIPSIPMRPGVFRLVSAITGDRAGHVVDYIPRSRTFDVVGKPIESGGVMVMHSRFENLVQA